MTPFAKRVEITLADVLFFAMRKNLMLFKDLGDKHIHYSIFIRGSLIDFHKTLEGQDTHIPLAEMEFDWQFLIKRMAEEITADWRSIFQTVKADDPEWKDLEIEFVPAQALIELLSSLMKGARWNVDVEFLKRLEQSLERSTFGELADRGLIIGTGSGYLIMSNGTECILFDTDKMSRIFERSFESSIRRIRLSHYTPRSLLWFLRIRLLILNNSAIRNLRKLTS
jgi:hypothetical protein